MGSIKKRIFDFLERYPLIVDLGRSVLGSRLVTNSSLYHRYCLNSAKRYDAERPYGSLRLNIETTLACNARCIMCTKNSYPLKVGTMSDHLYEKIIGEARALGVTHAVLSVYGEPLLDRHFLDRARLADDAGIKFSFYTNGSLLTEKISRELLGMKYFNHIYFSVNGFTKKTYEEIMVGLDRDVVFENIDRFLKLKDAMGSNVSVNVNCVIFERNKAEKNVLKKYFQGKKGVDCVYFPMLRSRGGTTLDIELGCEAVSFSPLAQPDRNLLPCKFLWEDLFIYWNGDVGVCCEDTAARRIIVGNTNRNTLEEIWRGKKLASLRRLHRDDKRRMHPVCGGECPYNTVWLKPHA